mgnify:FL=1
MPCVRDDNGQVVPGAFGSCPIGSTWQNNAAPQISMEGAPKEEPLQRLSIEPISRGTQLAAGGLAVAAPFIRGGFNYAKNRIKDPDNIKRLAGLKNRLFKRFNQPERPKYPIMNKSQQAAWNKANPGKFEFDPLKLTAWAGGAGLSLPQLMGMLGGGDDTKAETKEKTEPAYMNDAQRREQLNSAPKEVSKMEKLTNNIKDPKWWMESMSSDKADTRLMRLGQLMDYYGRTPKGRAAVDMPAKVWAANAAASAKGNAKNYTALKNMILSPSEITKQIYIDGGSNILGFGGMDEDEKSAAAQARGNAINALMHELAMGGQMPTFENAKALYYARNPDKDPRKNMTNPEEEEEKSWWDFT